MMRRLLALTALLSAACTGASTPVAENWVIEPMLVPQNSGTDASFIAVSVVNADTVWASGSRGTWVRTTDGGATWHAGTVPGADSLAFRDVHAVNGSTAYLLSIGNGEASRIYKTTDAGLTWTLQFTNAEPDGFFDCFGFWDGDHGIAFSDSFNHTFYLITTEDGSTWTRVPVDRLPEAHEGEGGFASSGTCLVVAGDSSAWIGTGASETGARVLHTTNRGQTWSVVETPIVKAASAGITTLAFRDASHGAALGGDIGKADSTTDNVAITHDGGVTWTLASRPPFTGAVYGSAFVPGAPQPTLVAVGPRGIAYTPDEAATWTPLDTLNHWGVAFASPTAGWAVGPRGRITRINMFRPAS
jgi:photosystem II stability/assembly factor-like uncharacterized protein